MLFNILPILLIFTAMAVIIIIIVRRLPEITALNTDTISEARSAEIKRQLLVQRLERKLRHGLNSIWESTAAWRLSAKEKATALYQKLCAMEDHYRKAKGAAVSEQLSSAISMPSDPVGQLVWRADQDRQAGRWTEAEEFYLEAIGLDHHCVDAYLGLGLIYKAQRQYREAVEALSYAKKLREDITTTVAFGEACIEAGRAADALSAFQAAVRSEPSNEHYLDRLLEAAILLRKKQLAAATLSQLTKLNSEYPKLVEFKQRITAIPSKQRKIERST